MSTDRSVHNRNNGETQIQMDNVNNNGEGFNDKDEMNEKLADSTPYQQKKWMAQGLLDIALLSANANQLRYILDSNASNHYFYVSLTFISLSLILQVLVAIALVFKFSYNVKKKQEPEEATLLNYFIMIGIVLITISSVISSSFAPAPPL